MKIYLGEVIHPAAVALLEKHAEVLRPRDPTRGAFLEAIRPADGLLARKIYIGAEEMDAAPKLKIIGRHGVGLDSVDLKAATARGILVINTPGANRESVAELTLAFLLNLARKIPRAQAAMCSLPKGDVGVLSALLKQYDLTGVDLEGKSLGIIGTGRIGSAVARKCIAAFAMKAYGYDPYVSAETMKSFGALKVDRLAEMLPGIDFLTVHCPLTEETRGLVAKKELALLKKGACVVNTARGGIINERDLYEALTLGHVAGAALDVFEIEPPDPEDPLIKHPSVLATPHYAGTTEESLHRIGILMVEEVVNFLKGKPVRHAVNPEVLKSKRQ